MNGKYVSAIFLTLAVLCSFLVSSLISLAQDQHGNQLQVVATIQPNRIIVVNDSLVITEIVSNTSEDIRPIVVRGTQDGQQISYSDAVQSQYAALKASIDFSRPGIVYEKEDRPVQAALKRVLATIEKWMGLSSF